jgi:rhodanese-related sulfurtransferase
MYSTIDRETLKKKLDNHEEIHLIEVLAEKEFQRLHIKGAEHIQFGEIGKIAKQQFNPEDEIIVYCADKECKASPTAAKKLETMGFTNVYDYEEGKKDWVEAGYPVEGNEAGENR